MSYKVKGTTIDLTRGDTFLANISLTDENGDPYIFSEGDKVRFAAKSSYEDESPVIEKDIPTNTMVLELAPEDTKELAFGSYVFDIQLTTSDGRVDTFITKGILRLTEEVD